MSKLKPCPCCSGEVEITKDNLMGFHVIECKKCKILMYDRHKEDLINRWNTRKPMQNDETIGIVKSEFEDMKGHLDSVLNALLSEKETELSEIYNSQIERMITQNRMEYKNEIIDDVIDIIKREFLL